jgi:hypothetical protein
MDSIFNLFFQTEFTGLMEIFCLRQARYPPAEGPSIQMILSILVCQAKPGQSSELKGVHLVNCPFAK